MLLFQFPEEVLHCIFCHLDYKSLGRLCQVCKAFNEFVNRDAVWRKIARGLLNTGITWNGTDIYPHIPLKERVKTAQNWGNGACKRFIPLKWKTKLLPWLQLDGDVLFLSQATNIGLYRLHRDSRRLQQTAFKIYSGHKGDVCCFALTDSHLISGGSIVHVPYKFVGSQTLPNCVCALKLRFPRSTICMADRVWSVAVSPTVR
uniref:F-box and WD repeat domain containing 4 n=1 Tax=Oryzias sinensis TaxID=183150 RepID=A0A8C7Z771_9TELE